MFPYQSLQTDYSFLEQYCPMWWKNSFFQFLFYLNYVCIFQIFQKAFSDLLLSCVLFLCWWDSNFLVIHWQLPLRSRTLVLIFATKVGFTEGIRFVFTTDSEKRAVYCRGEETPPGSPSSSAHCSWPGQARPGQAWDLRWRKQDVMWWRPWGRDILQTQTT